MGVFRNSWSHSFFFCFIGCDIHVPFSQKPFPNNHKVIFLFCANECWLTLIDLSLISSPPIPLRKKMLIGQGLLSSVLLLFLLFYLLPPLSFLPPFTPRLPNT